MTIPGARVVIWRNEEGRLHASLGFVSYEDPLHIVLATTYREGDYPEGLTRIAKESIEGGQECDLNVSLSFLKAEEEPNEVHSGVSSRRG